MIKNKSPLILASKSLIRRRILENAGLEIRAIEAKIDERVEIENAGGEDQFTPEQMALFLAALKAKTVSDKLLADKKHNISSNNLVLGCDQVLGFNGTILHKAKTIKEAHNRINQLQGKTHCLYSGLAIFQNGIKLWDHLSICELNMIELSDDNISEYIHLAGSNILSSVGCYQLEHLGIQLFSSIKGDYFSILGLPLLPLLGWLRENQP